MRSFITRRLLALAAALVITLVTGWGYSTAFTCTWAAAGQESPQNVA